jgi:hypothetical protein
MFFYINLTDQYQSATCVTKLLPRWQIAGEPRHYEINCIACSYFLIDLSTEMVYYTPSFLMVLVATSRICDLPQVPQFEATEASNREFRLRAVSPELLLEACCLERSNNPAG